MLYLVRTMKRWASCIRGWFEQALRLECWDYHHEKRSSKALERHQKAREGMLMGSRLLQMPSLLL